MPRRKTKRSPTGDGKDTGRGPKHTRRTCCCVGSVALWGDPRALSRSRVSPLATQAGQPEDTVRRSRLRGDRTAPRQMRLAPAPHPSSDGTTREGEREEWGVRTTAASSLYMDGTHLQRDEARLARRARLNSRLVCCCSRLISGWAPRRMGKQYENTPTAGARRRSNDEPNQW